MQFVPRACAAIASSSSLRALARDVLEFITRAARRIDLVLARVTRRRPRATAINARCARQRWLSAARGAVAAYVEIMPRKRRSMRRAAACDELEDVAGQCASDELDAMAAHARGTIALAAGDAQAALVAARRGAAGLATRPRRLTWVARVRFARCARLPRAPVTTTVRGWNSDAFTYPRSNNSALQRIWRGVAALEDPAASPGSPRPDAARTAGCCACCHRQDEQGDAPLSCS